MERWTIEERICAVEWFIRTGSIIETQRGFRRQLNRRDSPSDVAIRRWVSQWRLNGSVVNKSPPGRPRSVRTPENIARVRESVVRSPKRSAKKHGIALQISDRSVRRILHHDLNFHPYKMQVAQQLLDRDKVLRLEFCQTLRRLMNQHPTLINNLLMSDEAHFHLSGTVNKQNMRYWSAENPCVLHQRPLHDPKVTVWCAVSSSTIIGPYFFENEDGQAVTVNSQRYRHMLQTFLVPELHEHENLWFQQDGATAHTARISMAVLRNLFPGRLISRFGDVPWPARSPDLTAPDFFLWGYLKHKVFITRPQNLEQLKERIREAIREIQPETLQRVMNNFQSRVQQCVQSDGAHLIDVLFRK